MVTLTVRRLARGVVDLARIGAVVVVLARLARAARPPAGPVTLPTDQPPTGTAAGPRASGPGPLISVVIPARNEAARIGPLLAALAADSTVGEVLVVDDESTDATASVAAAAGATVVPGAALPVGWVGKPWALEQGLRQARGEWVVAMDADVEPAVGLAAAVVSSALAGRWDLVSITGRFVCPTPALRWLHPALLTTLVYRFGPPGVPPRRSSRAIANGQCLAARRGPLVTAGGFALAAGHMTDDIALVRALAGQGWRTVLLDGSSQLRVRMHADAAEAWRNWGRSLPMADVTTPSAQALDLLTLVLTQAAPLPRLLLRRADVLDVVLLLVRVGTLAGTASAYEARGLTYWLSPLADGPAVARVMWGALRPGRSWRGRTY